MKRMFLIIFKIGGINKIHVYNFWKRVLKNNDSKDFKKIGRVSLFLLLLDSQSILLFDNRLLSFKIVSVKKIKLLS
jgi:hypothetical protein